MVITLIMISMGVSSCRRSDSAASSLPEYGYRIVTEFAHDRNASTQGLVYDEDWLYEGTGRYGYSSLRKVGLRSGNVVQERKLPSDFFGEGICIVNDRIIQLTWREKTGFVYDKATFRKISEFSYESEGWGITYDGKRLIMSDGTSFLRFWDPNTFSEIGRIEVTADTQPLTQLNELEMVGNDLYANIWQDDRIAIIDLQTGQVKSFVNLSGLLPDSLQTAYVDVLNGIAYDPDQNRLFVTGKLWPKVFQIEVTNTPASKNKISHKE
ncbi:MAG: glutaminyl-peptide cyclotransferase [Sedimentisphaerales bacterium]|nr:glutaminyl-peptide cyclotransferase [Sedimentisphaerales bacterium]